MDDELPRRIGYAWRELRRGASMGTLRDLLQGEVGLDLGQLDTLEQLVLSGGCRMSELAEGMRVDASTATRAVQRLVEAGLARRAGDPADARCVQVQATPAGETLYADQSDRRFAALSEMVAELDPAERLQLAEGMEHLVAALDKYVERETARRATES